MKKAFTIVLLVLTGFAFCYNDTTPKIFLVGDSTMANKPTNDNPERGWGQILPSFFNEDVQIENHAVNGRSTKSFINEKRWDSVLNSLHKGDWVLIQFGHNDEKKEDSTRYAAPQTTYRNNLIKFVNETRSKGANPVLITPVMRRKFDSADNFVDQHGEYPDVVRSVAKEMNVPLIDLHQSSKKVIEEHGVEGSKKIFLFIPKNHFKKYKGKEDNTHFSEYGASLMASLVCESIKTLNLPIAQFLKQSPFKEKLLYELPKVYVPHFKKDTLNIVQFGAVSSSHTLSTTAINNAIDSCSKSGGGTVIIPKGRWFTGPVVLKSNVNLHLDKGASITFTPDLNQYPLVASSYEGLTAARCQSPISANYAENIAITGEGKIDAGGDAWRPLKKGKFNDAEWKSALPLGGILSNSGKMWFPSVGAELGFNLQSSGELSGGKTLEDYAGVKDFLRPTMFHIANCKNVLFEGITVTNSPAWTLHFLLSEHITLLNVHVDNPWYSANTDGIDLECCKNARLEGCTFNDGDDGICIKSGKDEEGRRRGIPSENIIINNCTVYRAHGGFVIGSEMSGGVKNMFVSNCSFEGTDIGLRFKTKRGRGGVVENIYVSNIKMKGIINEAILFDTYYEGSKNYYEKVDKLPVTDATPQFKNFYIRNITCKGATYGIFVRGIPEMKISNVLLEDLTLDTQIGAFLSEADGITMNNVTLLPDDTDPLITILNAGNINVTNLKFKKKAHLIFSLIGDETKNVTLSKTDVSTVKKQVECSNNADCKTYDFVQ